MSDQDHDETGPTDDAEVRGMLARLRDVPPDMPAARDKWERDLIESRRRLNSEAADLLQSLAAERDRLRDCLRKAAQRELDRPLFVLDDDGKVKNIYDPATYIPVPREILAEIYWLCGSGDPKVEMKIEAKVSALLTAAEEKGE